jgi:hypothetical protein
MSTSLVHTFVSKFPDAVLVFKNEETLLNNLDGVAVTSHSEGQKLLQRASEALLHHIRWRRVCAFIHLPAKGHRASKEKTRTRHVTDQKEGN